MEINRYIIYCNTSQRSSGTFQHAYFNCKPAYVKKHPLHWFSTMITSAEIPYQWTQVNNANNILNWTYTSGSTITNGSLKINQGNYNVTTLLTELFYEISITIPAHSWSNTSTYNSSENKIIFSIKGTDHILTSINLKFSQNTFLGTMFGCNVDTIFGYDINNNSIINNSNTTVNVNPVSSIYIRSSSLKQISSTTGNNQENMVLNNSPDMSDILAKIQVLTPPFTYVFWTNQVKSESRLSINVIDSFDLYLSDNVSFDLNISQNWTFGITFIEYAPYDHPQYDFLNKHSGNLHDIHITQEPQIETQSENLESEAPKNERKKFQREHRGV